MDINEIKITKPFLGLFPFNKRVYKAVLEDMKENGYDYAHPVIVWEEQQILIDGHCRTMVAQELKMEGVPASLKHFKDEEEALEYAIHNQRDRRNLTDAEILSCIAAVDKRKEKGGDRKSEDFQESKSKSAIAPIEKTSAEKTAEAVGTSPDKVKRARVVLDHADEETKQEVLAGEKSIHEAYKETQKKRKPPPKIDSKPTRKEPQKETGINQELQTAFDTIKELIDTEIKEGWKTNSKKAVIQYLNSLIAFVREGK